MAERRPPKAKVKSPGSIPSAPANELDWNRIKRASDIPDEYIKKTIAIEAHRVKTKRIINHVPLFKSMMNYIVQQYNPTNNDLRGGIDVDMGVVAQAIRQFLPSDYGLSLYNKAKIFKVPGVWNLQLMKTKNAILDGTEIVLCQEAIIRESDEKLLSRLKIKVFNDHLTELAKQATIKKPLTTVKKKTIRRRRRNLLTIY